jgi:hypothetical protein
MFRWEIELGQFSKKGWYLFPTIYFRTYKFHKIVMFCWMLWGIKFRKETWKKPRWME